MLRQTISTSTRAVRAAGARAAASSTRPLARPQLYQTTSLSSVARLSMPVARARWYTSEAEKPKTDAKDDAASAAAPAQEAENNEIAQLKKQLEAKEAEAREWKDQALRSVADFRNLQDRMAREMKAARDFAIQKFAKDLVESVDNFDRALAVVPEDKINKKKGDNPHESPEHLQDLVNLYEGLKMTESILMQTLKKHGLERFDPNGETFNPNEHEATFMTPMQDKEHNTVFHTQEKGFKLNGRVLRPAKVGVVKNK